MKQKEKNNEVWDNINQNSIEFMEKNFEFAAPVLIKHLIASVSNEKKFEIGIFEDKLEKGSSIIYNKSNNIKKLELRCLNISTFQLVLYIYKGDKTFTYNYKLTWEDTDIIPYNIQSLMKEVGKLNTPKYFIIT